jgi:hypothetical protein
VVERQRPLSAQAGSIATTPLTTARHSVGTTGGQRFLSSNVKVCCRLTRASAWQRDEPAIAWPVSRSGKEVLLPAPPPLRTARAPFNARSSSIGQRTSYGTRWPALAWRTPWTLLRGSQHTQPSEAAPARALRSADLSALLPQVGLPTVHVRQHPREVCTLAGGVATPIRSITDQPSLAPSSFTRSPIGSPCGALSLAGGLRAYHVPLTSPSG